MATALYKIVVAVHVLSAITLIGGVLFIGVIALPASRKFDAETGKAVRSALGRAFRPVSWATLLLLVATGTYMIIHWGITWETLFDLSFFSAPHTRLLGYKLLAVTAMLVVNFVHDWIIGPRASAAELGSEAYDYYRRWAAILGSVTGILVIVIAVLAVFVARPWLA